MSPEWILALRKIANALIEVQIGPAMSAWRLLAGVSRGSGRITG
jgi:hypothetical protein